MAKTRLEGSNPSLSAMFFSGSSCGIRTGAAAERVAKKRATLGARQAATSREDDGGIAESHRANPSLSATLFPGPRRGPSIARSKNVRNRT